MEALHVIKYIYSAFDIIIESDIEIPSFIKSAGTVDVRILLGNIPDNIENAVYDTQKLKVSEKEFILFRNEADYYVKGGNTIIVNAHDSADKILSEGFLTGIIMGALLFQRGLIIIHGSAIAAENKGLIFTGGSGAGKSTLCAAFRKYGYEYLSDDIIAVEFKEGGAPVILPSFPQQRLKKDVAKGLGYKFKKMIPSDGKYITNDNFDFSKSSIPLFSIYRLQPEHINNVEMQQISGSDKLKLLIENLYFSEIFIMAANADYFIKLSNFANEIKWYNMSNPAKKHTIRTQMKKIIGTLQA